MVTFKELNPTKYKNYLLELAVIFLCNFLTIGTTSRAAENYFFKQYFVENGLSNNNVTCCIQDASGFMWIGTRDGLNRFDGYSFRVFRDTDEGRNPLGNNWILSLAIDHLGALWIGTFMGVYKYNEKEENFETIPFCKGLRASNLIFDTSGDLWINLEGKLVRYNDQLKDHQTYNIPDNANISSFCYTSTEKIWLALSNGMLYQFDISNGEFRGFDLFSHSPNYKIKNLTTVYPSVSEDKLFIGSKTHGAKLFDIQNLDYKDILTKEIEQIEICVNDFLQVSPNEVWMASESGLYIYNMAKDSYSLCESKTIDPYSLSTNHLYSIYRDKEKGIWIGTYSGGINYYSPFQPFRKYYAYPGENNLQGNIIHDITTDQYDNLWIATEDAGLNKYNPRTAKYTHYGTNTGKQSVSHKNLHGLVADGNHIWVGSIMGIDLIDILSGNVVKHYKINDNRTIVILKKLPNGMLLAGTSNGMFMYNKANDQFEPMVGFPAKVRIQSIMEDHSGVIWAGTFNNGLYFYNPGDKTSGKFRHDTIPTNNDNTINDIFEDDQHNIWLATQAGLKKINRDNGRITRFTVRNGMPANITFRILCDQKKNLWVSTTNGLVCLNPLSGKISVFKKEHGLITNQFNYNSSWKDKTGTMYFGMVKGMISFQPESITEIPGKSQVFYTDMTIFDHTVNTASKKIPVAFVNRIRLKYSQSTFKIDFSTLSFIAPENTTYAFCLEGLNNDWIFLNNTHTAHFTKVPPGHYSLKVKSSNLSGTWNVSPTTLSISVLPPWWLSKIALLVYFLLCIAAILLVIRSIIRKNRKKVEEKISRMVYEKEKELHKAKINFFINIAHEIRTPLTLITGPLEKVINDRRLPVETQHYLDIMDKNAKRLLKLVDQLLDFRETELQGYRLSFERKEIIAIFHENFIRFKDAAEENKLKFEITSNVKQLFISVDEEAFMKIFSNLLANAVKYAKSRIKVSLNYTEGEKYFSIYVSNDGQKIPSENKNKIFQPFFRGENAEFKPGTGLGLPIAKSLAELHMGTLELLDTENNLITFRLNLPVTPTSAEDNQDDEKETGNTSPEPLQENFSYDESRPTVLIVEDNDEMRSFVGHEINTAYNVLTAGNGEEAMTILKERNVQLIVSDIMMPVMDGISLLKKVKTDIDFSHVPVILLTARNTVQSRLEGLESGADAYIEKPFTVNILMAQITNLLNNRDSIRRYYFNSPIANLKSMAHTKADELFLENLNEIISDNISNTRLDVEMIAEKMNMSRPTLYRKIKAISDLTPNELIRISRLKKAAEFITEGKLTLSEISEKVGFSSQSYFSRSFSKQFEISPSEYGSGKF
jgi:signal transduction histidine kinase/ligand-binding sensor domain-containing protein/DNA-binding response OmpR family regulator